MTYLIGQFVLVLGALFGADRLPPPYGFVGIAVLVGALQYVQTILASTVYVDAGGGVLLSPGSVVLFGSSVAGVLLVYLRYDIERTRALIGAVVGSNLLLTGLSALTHAQLAAGASNLLEVDAALFQVDPRIFVSGTLMLAIDFLLIVVIYEWLGRRLALGASARALLAMVITLYADALGFTVLSFAGTDHFRAILVSQLVGKTLAAVVYGGALFLYVRYVANLPYRPAHDPLEIFTWRARLAQERADKADAIRASDAKSRFLARMSHEFRTPLNSIIGFSGHLLSSEDEGLTDAQRLFADRIHNNGLHMLELIGGVLDLSKAEADAVDVVLDDVDLCVLLDEVVEGLRGIVVAQPELTLTVACPASLPPIRSDPTLLRQIVTNLVGNALKFTEQGEVMVRVRALEGRAHAIDVEDTGIGIEAVDLARVFDAFTQADESDRRAYEGTGLGLAISQRLAVRLGYRLVAQSERGKGSTFTLLLDDG